MWTVRSESGTLHAVLVQDSVEQFWEGRLPFLGIESSPLYLPRCPHAQYEEGHAQWNQLATYLREEGVQVFEVVSILGKALEDATVGERRRIVEELWRGVPEAPSAEDLTIDHLLWGYPPKPYYDGEADRVVLPDFRRVAWPYPRDTSFTTQVGTVICSMRRYSRRFEPRVVKLVYRYDRTLYEKMEVIWDANEAETSLGEPLCIEGGDVQTIDEETVAVGVGQRSTSAGFTETAKKLFEHDKDGEIRHICAVRLADPPAYDYMHLDVVINYPDAREALVMPYFFDSEVVRDMPKKRLLLKTLQAVRVQGEKDGRPMKPLVHPDDFREAGRCAVYENRDGEPRLVRRELSLVDFLVKVEKLDPDGIIYVGGRTEDSNDVQHMMAAMMEQARGASNIVTIKPGLVISYKRNKRTIEALKEHGIRVKEWEDSHLDMLGGPHCSTSPLWRSSN